MRLLFELSERERQTLREVIGDEELLYCVPRNLSEGHRFVRGFGVVTRTRFVGLSEGQVACELPVSKLSDVVDRDGMGCGFLEAEIDGHPRLLAR